MELVRWRDEWMDGLRRWQSVLYNSECYFLCALFSAFWSQALWSILRGSYWMYMGISWVYSPELATNKCSIRPWCAPMATCLVLSSVPLFLICGQEGWYIHPICSLTPCLGWFEGHRCPHSWSYPQWHPLQRVLVPGDRSGWLGFGAQ